MTASDLDFARSFIAAGRWQTATTVPQWPHQYFLRDWASDKDAFDRFLGLIRDHGEPGYHVSTGRRAWVYLAIDEHRYWESQKLDGSGGLIVNRARRDLVDEPEPDRQLSLDREDEA